MAKPARFLVCGEALFDGFVTASAGDTAMTGLSIDVRLGGSPFNVAVGLARLGQQVALFAGVSHDVLGQHIMQALASEGVATARVVRKEAPTTLVLVQVDEQGIPAYTFYGEQAADRCLTQSDAAFQLNKHSILHLGSYSIVAEPTANSLFQLVQNNAQHCLISLDPNVRALIEPDMAVWKKRIHDLLPMVALLKASDEDIAALYPETQAEQVIANWQQSGCRLLVITHGSAGATLISAAHRIKVNTPMVSVFDTVGAGDTFQAALLDVIGDLYAAAPATWHEALDPATLRKVGDYAASAAALTCTKRGADLPGRAQLWMQKPVF